MRQVVRATEASDVEALLAEVRSKLTSSPLDVTQQAALIAQVETALKTLVAQGRLLAANGSQMQAERKLSAGPVEVMIEFAVGQPKSFLGRLRDLFGGR